MTVTDEELAAQQQRVAVLRQQVIDENAKRVARENSLQNDVTYNQLAVEAANLEAELAAARAANGNTDENSTPLAVLKEQVEVAEQRSAAAQDASGVPATPPDDTNVPDLQANGLPITPPDDAPDGDADDENKE